MYDETPSDPSRSMYCHQSPKFIENKNKTQKPRNANGSRNATTKEKYHKIRPFSEP